MSRIFRPGHLEWSAIGGELSQVGGDLLQVIGRMHRRSARFCRWRGAIEYGGEKSQVEGTIEGRGKDFAGGGER